MENDETNSTDNDSSGINVSSIGTMGSLADSYNYDGDLYKTWYVRAFVRTYTLLIGLLLPPFGLYMLYGYLKKIKARH